MFFLLIFALPPAGRGFAWPGTGGNAANMIARPRRRRSVAFTIDHPRRLPTLVDRHLIFLPGRQDTGNGGNRLPIGLARRVRRLEGGRTSNFRGSGNGAWLSHLGGHALTFALGHPPQRRRRSQVTQSLEPFPINPAQAPGDGAASAAAIPLPAPPVIDTSQLVRIGISGNPPRQIRKLAVLRRERLIAADGPLLPTEITDTGEAGIGMIGRRVRLATGIAFRPRGRA